MAVLREDPIHKDRFLVSESVGQPPKLGAQVNPDSDLTVYWSGKVSQHLMLDLVREAVHELAINEAAKFVAYGKNMRAVYFLSHGEFSPSAETRGVDEGQQPLNVFDACRAELSADLGTVVVWANVAGSLRTGLDKGGENIGVSVPTDIFEGAGREFITHAIELTMGMKKAAISPLLDSFSDNLLHRRRPAAG